MVVAQKIVIAPLILCPGQMQRWLMEVEATVRAGLVPSRALQFINSNTNRISILCRLSVVIPVIPIIINNLNKQTKIAPIYTSRFLFFF